MDMCFVIVSIKISHEHDNYISTTKRLLAKPPSCLLCADVPSDMLLLIREQYLQKNPNVVRKSF